jgi:hypothetical protein
MGTTPARPIGFRARTGAVDVFGSSAMASQRFWTDRTNTQLGSSIAILDFNGDGRQDVAVGDLGEFAGGTDMIARGSLANSATDPCWLRNNSVIATSSASRGIVRIYLQNTDGTLREGFWAIGAESIPMGGAARRAGFGAIIANAGDINNDGISDLLVGHLGGAGTNGAEVILGRAADSMGRISVVCTDPATSPYWASRSDGTVFGATVAALGDLDNDGCSDTAASISAAGHAGFTVQYGFGPACRRGHRALHEMYVVPDDRPLRANAVSSVPPRVTALDWIDLPGAATGLGSLIAGGGDLNGDRVFDIAVRDNSLNFRDRTTPAVEIISGAWLNALCPEHVCPVGLNDRFYSDGAGYNVVGLRLFTAPTRMIVPAYDTTGVRFAASLAVADIDSNGIAELLVGSPDDSTLGPFAGAILGWTASSDEQSFSDAPSLIAVGDLRERSQFGTSISSSRDTSGAWFAVGAPGSSHRGALTGAAYRWRIDR